MNVAVINIKDLLKLAVKIILLVLMFVLIISALNKVKINFGDDTLTSCMNRYISLLKYNDGQNSKKVINVNKIFNIGLGTLNKETLDYKGLKTNEEELSLEDVEEEVIKQVVANLQEDAATEKVEENNIKAKYTNTYNGVEINNQSDYELTEEMLTPNIEFKDKRDVFIYHTHTCESYTPSPNFQYEQTGNYRTNDLNYSVARVGTELTNYLQKKGFNATHNTTYHDYPSYSGSYNRALETIQSALGDSNTEIVIDLHRDAVGDGSSYGPTVKIDNEYVAQLMLVIGTDSGGLEHINWQQNLKFAIKLQEKANEMYPGLFRPIILRNSRYNQHIRPKAFIVEVGATGNTMEQCILSMQCLANIMEKICE